jgi:quercetin dioxygenase-like cupin family protein
VVRYSGDYVPHSHSADEFIYILEGGLELEIGNETVPLQQGEAMLIPAGITHRARCKNTALALVVETKRLQTEGTD